MKGLFFKDSTGKGFEIVSDPIPVRNERNSDDIMVVVMRLDDNFINCISVLDICNVVSLKEHIGY